MQIRITDYAEQDLLDGHDFYESQQTGLGTYFLNQLFSDIDALRITAGIHPKLHFYYHRCLANRFPFAIYYQIQDNLVLIVAILDCRQNPRSIKIRIRSGH